MGKTAVLLMAYGTPRSPEEIEPYYTDIRGGRKPTSENLRELVGRYQRIGGKTPLLEITRAQANALQALLGDEYKVYIGMKHWHPYLAQAVEEIAQDGLHSAIAVALAPHYSRFSIDGYIQRVTDAIQNSKAPLQVTFVRSWNVHPLFLSAVAEKMEAQRKAFGVSWDQINGVFSAHSLPERILASNDPYPQELRETCEEIATRIGLGQWRFAYQSAGRTGEKWLGPEILETLDEIAEANGCNGSEKRETKTGAKCRVLIAPIGFVADHLEVLYDIDVECAERARALGIEMRRIESPNANPQFIAALAAIVRENMSL